jgi:hypothetical protein
MIIFQTFREILLIFVVTPSFDFFWYGSSSEHWYDVWRTKRESCARLIEHGIKINLGSSFTQFETNREGTGWTHGIGFPSLSIYQSNSVLVQKKNVVYLCNRRHIFIHAAYIIRSTCIVLIRIMTNSPIIAT